MVEFLPILRDYGPFVALVAFVLWESRQREAKYQDREGVFIQETRERERKYVEREERYIEREDKYITVIEGLSESISNISDDVAEIKNKLYN